MQSGREEHRQVVSYMPANFCAMLSILADVGIDVFIVQVAPMGMAGFFSCGTNADYTIPTGANRRATDYRGQSAYASGFRRFCYSHIGCRSDCGA